MALFVPFRALGYITDDVPFAVQRRGKETFVTVSVGKSWQIYNASTLRLALVGPQLPKTIVALACHRDRTFAGTENSILECIRVHRSGEYSRTRDILPGRSTLLQMLVLGDFLISLWRDGMLVMWRIGEYDSPVREIQFEQTFVPTCMTHPDTYVNKILVGSEDGRMQLWNFNTTTCLYEFSSVGSAIRCIVSSPALDVVGLGLTDGRVLLHNVKYDKPVMQFSNAAGAGSNLDLYITGSAAQIARKANSGACTALAFRTGNGPPLMAVGGNAGVVTVWDLDKQRLHCTIRDAHDAKLISLHFFAGEPVLLSAGADNSLKEWIFDGPDGSPRLLRFRSGHAAPPTIVRHYGDGKRLLSGGQDRAFRCFSTIQDAQSRELSQKHTKRRAKRHRVEEIELKLHRITAVDSCDVRERDWSNVLTAHEDDTCAYVWRLQRYAIGEHILTPPPKELKQNGGNTPLRPVTAVCISHCGNFGFVGSASGRLDRYNMQSGLHRGAYYRVSDGDVGNVEAVKPGKNPKAIVSAHDGAIYGLGVDDCNRYLVSAGLDKKIRVWDFAKKVLKGEMHVDSAISRVAHHSGTGLLVAACDDLVLRMYDVEALRLVRRFMGHTDRITDMQLSKDCKWLLSASMDNTLRVWDVPGCRILQVLRLGSPVTSLSFSPSQDLLATTHVERRGVYMWANQLVFGSGTDVVTSEKPIRAKLPRLQAGFSSHSSEEAVNEQAISGPSKLLEHKSLIRHTTGKKKREVQNAETVESDASADDNMSMDGICQTGSDFDSFESSESEFEKEGIEMTAASFQPDLLAAHLAGYLAKDTSGAPVPLVPHLITMSMLPRTQWLNLVHLDTIKERNKPIEPPRKPEAAPFFLPTISHANAGRDVVFDELRKDKGDGDGDGNGKDDGDTGEKIMVLGSSHFGANGKLAGGESRFIKLLRQCSSAGDWTSLIGVLRDMSPVEIDQEIRSLQPAVFMEENGGEVADDDILLFLQFIESETASSTNFDFMQAILSSALSILGETLAERPVLRQAAARIEQRVNASWKRLDSTLQHVRCMVGLLGRLQ